MLQRNTIEGILPVCWQKEDNKYLLRYDITGKQALDVLLENRLVDETVLRSLLLGICVAVKQLEKYLLLQEGLLLLPETVFWDGKSETMHFCYYPEVEEPLQVHLVRLMEYILAKTDHKNVLAVQLVYGVYEEVQKSTFCINNLQEHLFGVKTYEGGRQQEDYDKEKTEDVMEEVYERDFSYIEKGEAVKKIWKIGAIENFMGWIREKIKKMPREKKVKSMVVIETEESEEPEVWTETRVLGSVDSEIEGVLRYEGGNLLSDINVSKMPFLLGSAKDCDGIINYPTISRYHAKISMREGIYFIEDLNSTNGTKVNGGLLSYKTKVSLKKNDRICFANEPYRFL